MAGGNHSDQHTKLRNEVLGYLGLRQDVMVWNNPTGLMVPWARRFEAQPVQCGRAGQPDVLAIVAPHGRLVGIECKTGKGKAEKDQKSWRDLAQYRGAIYGVVRNMADVEALIQKAKQL